LLIVIDVSDVYVCDSVIELVYDVCDSVVTTTGAIDVSDVIDGHTWSLTDGLEPLVDSKNPSAAMLQVVPLVPIKGVPRQ
jgi:hypothetical protein